MQKGEILLPLLRFIHAHIGQVAIIAVIIEAITEHELVGDDEAAVIRRDIALAAGGLVQQAGDLERSRLALKQNLCKIVERKAAIHNILYDEHMAARNVRIHILGDAHNTGGLAPVAIA